jgi:1L-myo-inositol 1-phosphate cytidylyltransferase / CDP-L-myo-inositol myo-inositolphosphotransferase
MNKNTNPQNFEVADPYGILYLLPPPKPWKATEWYSTSIAGMPLLLRNILTLQRSGLHNLTLFIDAEETEKLALLVEKNSRITAKINWITKPEQLKETLQNRKSRILFFNGSALHDKKEVRFLYEAEKTKTPEVLPISSDQLESLIEKIQLNSEKELRETFESESAILYVPGAEQNQIQEPKDFNTLHEQLLKGSGQNHDSTITRFLSRPVSRKLTRFFLNTPITPNQITLFSFAVGLGSALCFAQGTYQMNLTGALLLLFSTWVDGADGEIARLKFMETELGGKLDIACDNIVHFFVFGAIGLGVSEATGDKTYMYVGGLAAFASLTSFILLGASLIKKSSTSLPESQSSLADKLANRDFIHFLMLMALIDLVNVFIFITAGGATIFATYLIYLRIVAKSPAHA